MVNIEKVSVAASGLALLGLLSISSGFSVPPTLRFRTNTVTPLYAVPEDKNDRENLEKLFHMNDNAAISTYEKIVSSNTRMYNELMLQDNPNRNLKLTAARELWEQVDSELGEIYDENSAEFYQAMVFAQVFHDTMQDAVTAPVLKRYEETLKALPSAETDLAPFFAEFNKIQNEYKNAAQVDAKTVLDTTTMLQRAIDAAEN